MFDLMKFDNAEKRSDCDVICNLKLIQSLYRMKTGFFQKRCRSIFEMLKFLEKNKLFIMITI